MEKAIYAFSGDPITYGHIDIVERAARIFDHVVVGIGVNPDKNYLFSLDERVEMATRSLSHIPNVSVTPFTGLLVHYAYEQGIRTIVRGVRSQADFDYEYNFHQNGDTQRLDIETLILMARPGLAHISSSVVKAIQKEYGDIHQHVPLYVKQQLEAKMSGQYIIGVTGEIASGKSYVSSTLAEIGRDRGIEVHEIELDTIGHQILGNLHDEAYIEVRDRIEEAFGHVVRNPDQTINRRELGSIVFNNADERKKLDEIMFTPMMVRVGRELYGKKGIILFSAALQAELDLGYLSNNNVVLVHTDKASQARRLRERLLSPDQIDRRLKTQYSYSRKKRCIEEAISCYRWGRIWVVENSDGENPERITSVFDSIVEVLGVKSA